MLTRDVQVQGFDASDFIALAELFEPRPSAASGGVVVVVDRGHVVKMFSPTSGRLTPTPAAALVPLEALALEHRAAFALRIERSSLVEISDRFGRRMARGDSFLGQILTLVSVLRELAEEGGLETYPRDLRTLGLPREATVERVFDTVCPVGKTLLVGAFEGPDVLTAVALRRGAAGFDRVVGPAEVRREMGLVSSDWPRNVPGLARAVELSVGPLALGCFAQARTFRALSRSGAPGAWTAAVASREVVFHPLAPAVAIPLGVDFGLAAFAAAREFATRFGVVLSRSVDGSDGARLLGFDPMTLLRDLLSGSRSDR